jgi:hypothetical protein
LVTTISEGVAQATRHVLHVELQDGKELDASVDTTGSSRVLDDVLQQLESATFVRLGDETIVRTAEVRCVRIREELSDEGGDAGLVDSLKQRLGGNEMSYEPQRGRTAVQQRPDGSQGEPGIADQFFAYGRGRPWAETKPFFLTSEFLAFVLAAGGVLIAAWVADNFEAPRAWLIAAIVASAYIVSRGLAKAGTRDPNPRHDGESWRR